MIEIINMEQKRIFGNIKGGFTSIKEEISYARLFLSEANFFFHKKKKGTGKSKSVFTEQTSFLIDRSISEIEKIVDMQETDIDSFTLYRLRNHMENLQEKIDYINYLEKL